MDKRLMKLMAPEGDASGAGAGTPPAPITLPDNWQQTLPDDLKNDESLKMYKDLPTLVKTMLHAQKAVGADKLVIPSKHATDEDWINTYKKLGLPADIKDYQIETPEGVKFEPEFLEGLKVNAHKLGIMPKQTNALIKWFQDTTKQSMEKAGLQSKTETDQKIAALKTEWGAAYDDKLQKAQLALAKFGGAELVAYLNKTGLGNDPAMIKAFAGVADTMKEGAFKGGSEGGGSGALSPAEAQAQLDLIYGNKEHPFFLASHPGHANAMKEVEKLSAMAYRG